MNDDLIQRILDEKGKLPKDETDDSNAFVELYNYLDSASPYDLPAGFAHKVTARIEKEHTSHGSHIWLPLVLGVICIIGLFLSVLFLFNLMPDLQLTNSMTGPLIIMCCIALFIICVYNLVENKIAARNGI